VCLAQTYSREARQCFVIISLFGPPATRFAPARERHSRGCSSSGSLYRNSSRQRWRMRRYQLMRLSTFRRVFQPAASVDAADLRRHAWPPACAFACVRRVSVPACVGRESRIKFAPRRQSVAILPALRGRYVRRLRYVIAYEYVTTGRGHLSAAFSRQPETTRTLN